MSAGRCVVAALVVLVAAACDHGAAYVAPDPPTVGPFSATLPRRLTFSPGLDGTPSVSGTMLVYSQQSHEEVGAYTSFGREQCIAFMPLEGGTIQRRLCPDRLLPPDTLVDTWYDPSVSPDGSRIAFMWQRGERISALSFVRADLMVTPVDRPQDTLQVRHQVIWAQAASPNPILADVAIRITWADTNRLRFLASRLRIIKVKGGGAERVTDSVFEPLALQELDLTTRTARLVPGGDSVIAYDAAPGGGLWVVKSSDRTQLLHLDPVSGATTLVGVIPAGMADVIHVAGQAVAIRQDSVALEILDPATGAVSELTGFPGLLHRIVPAGGKRFVIEVEDGLALFGSPPDLWLLTLP